MRNAFITLAVAALALSMYSCQPDRSDFDAREEKLAKEIEKIDVQTTYRDIMMLYFDIIEDVYNQGKETREYDLKRLEDFEDGILKDFSEKLDIGSKEFWEEEDDKFGESLSDRINTLRPMMEEMMGEAYAEEDYNEPEMLEDSSFVIGKDTIKELEDGSIIFNRDTLTYEQFMQRIGATNE